SCVKFIVFFSLTQFIEHSQVAVNKKAEQSTGVICRPAIFLKLDLKPKFGQVQAIHKQVNQADFVIGIDMRIQAIHLPLISGFSLDKFHK
ncbi:MAG: hypothetical protein ACOYLP_10800, partial [Flavobacterium sp.]|uniref:hypothetical protein n=1 Tax=Flavobacterium sp. TaxID=239 RepID=UPI003BCA71B8